MSDAIPSPILDSVLKQSRSLISRNKRCLNLHIPLQELQSKLELIKDVINEAELMAVMFPKYCREWVCELQRVLYEADDLFDEASIRSTSGSGMVENVFSYLHNRLFDLTLAPKMKHINSRLGDIIDKFCRFNLIVAGEPGGPQFMPVARRGILRYHPDFVGNDYVRDDEFQMIGREDDKKEVMKMLFDEDPSNNVVVIRGKAGVGKTTLCLAVYLDEDIKSHFEFRLWVDFGNVGAYAYMHCWKKIIAELKRTEGAHIDPGIEEDQLDEDQLEGIFATFIADKKTLLVLDNFILIDEDCLDWLKSRIEAFSHKDKGVKVLLPHREEVIAEETEGVLLHREEVIAEETEGVYQLRDGLSEEHSRSIFERSAFGGNASVTERDLMVSLEKQILTRCGGNPAVLKGVGTLLYGNDNRRDMWEYFAYDFDFDNQYINYNKISVQSCPFPNSHHFIGYLSLFKDAELMYEDLMHQFAAHGFEFSDSARGSIDYGLISLTSLWDGNILGPFRKRKLKLTPESEETFSLFTSAESSVVGSTNDVIPKFSRHVSISSSAVGRQKGMLPDSVLEDVIHRRTLLFFGESFPTVIRVQTLDVLFSHLRYLRVLSLQDLRLRKIPKSIGRLIHLKYLNLSGNSFRELPVSVCSLKNLWTLKLIRCSELKWFPGQITNFRQLKHLEINMCLDLMYMPRTIAKLTTLQRLDRFVVSSSKGGLRYLEDLDNLNENLSIELPRKWKDSKKDSKRANLDRKDRLTSLEFKWYGANHSDNDDQYVLEQLKPCPGIKNLFVNNFGGKQYPSWLTSLTCLTKITLSRCEKCSFLPPVGNLPKLRSLTLVSMRLEYLEKVNIYGDEPFRSLEVLRIGCMPNLKAWFSDVTILIFSRIKVLEIWRCPSLMLMNLSSALEHLISLKQLMVSKCSKELDCLFDDTGDGMPWKALQALRKLTIEGFENLTALPRALQQLPALTSLEIKDWPRLKHLSSTLMLLIKLRRLTLSKCSEKLDWLYDDTEDGMPRKALRSLCYLTIEGFENLTALPRALQQLTALKGLKLKDCTRLKHLSSTLEHLNRLQRLTLSKCSEELDCLFVEADNGKPWNVLKGLRYLTIEGFENLTALPTSLRDLPPLYEFRIEDCKRLKWGANSLPAIRWLIVKSCPLFSRSIEEFKAEQPDAKVHVDG